MGIEPGQLQSNSRILVLTATLGTSGRKAHDWTEPEMVTERRKMSTRRPATNGIFFTGIQIF